MMDGSTNSLENTPNNGGGGHDDDGDPLASVELDLGRNKYKNGDGNSTKFALAKNQLMKLKGTKINDVQFPLVLIALLSIVLLIAVTTWEGAMTKYGYFVSIPSVSLVVSVLGLIGTQLCEQLYEQYGKYLAHCLFLWNFIGASWLTLSGPFITTGNGYFAAWSCVAASSMAMGITADAFKDKIKGLGSLMGLVASSIILILASMEHVGGNDRGAAVYAIVLSCFTVVLVVGMIALKKRGYDGGNQIDYYKFIGLCIFSFLWFVCACHATFHGPFVTTGNGYFSAWAGCACIFFAAYTAKKEIGIITTEEIVKGEETMPPPELPTGLSDDI